MTARRYELSDFEWSIIQPHLPNKPRGVPRADDRKVLNGIDWRIRTGSPWADIPERYGPATTCANRFRRWAKIGVWDRIFEAVSRAYDGDPAFSPFLYRDRNRVERFFNKLRHFRAVATRYEKYAAHSLAVIKLASTRIWLQTHESVS